MASSALTNYNLTATTTFSAYANVQQQHHPALFGIFCFKCASRSRRNSLHPVKSMCCYVRFLAVVAQDNLRQERSMPTFHNNDNDDYRVLVLAAPS
jgi:hypothetical protein